MINFTLPGALLLTFVVTDGEKQEKHRAAGKSESGSLLKTDVTLWRHDSCSLLDDFKQLLCVIKYTRKRKRSCAGLFIFGMLNRAHWKHSKPITFWLYCKLHQVATAWGVLLAWRDNTCHCLRRAAVSWGVEQNLWQNSEKKNIFSTEKKPFSAVHYYFFSRVKMSSNSDKTAASLWLCSQSLLLLLLFLLVIFWRSYMLYSAYWTSGKTHCSGKNWQRYDIWSRKVAAALLLLLSVNNK